MSFLELNASTAVLSVVAVLVVAYVSQKPRRPYAPGPKPSRIPFVGNLNAIQGLEDPELFFEWAGSELKEKYGEYILGPPPMSLALGSQSLPFAGDVVQLSVPGQKLLFLNSLKAVTDLFNRENYADRPEFTMAGEIMGVKHSPVLAPNGPYWKTQRKMLQQTIGDREFSREFSLIAKEESGALMARLSKDSSDPLEEIHL